MVCVCVCVCARACACVHACHRLQEYLKYSLISVCWLFCLLCPCASPPTGQFWKENMSKDKFSICLDFGHTEIYNILNSVRNLNCSIRSLASQTLSVAFPISEYKVAYFHFTDEETMDQIEMLWCWIPWENPWPQWKQNPVLGLLSATAKQVLTS